MRIHVNILYLFIYLFISFDSTFDLINTFFSLKNVISLEEYKQKACVMRAGNDPWVLRRQEREKQEARETRRRNGEIRRAKEEERRAKRAREEAIAKRKETLENNELTVSNYLGGLKESWDEASRALAQASRSARAAQEAASNGRKLYGQTRTLMLANENIAEEVKATKDIAKRLLKAGEALVKAANNVSEWTDAAAELD